VNAVSLRNAAFLIGLLVAATVTAYAADPLPPDATYRPLPTLPFSAVKANDEAQKPKVMQRHSSMLNERYDLSNRPSDVMMSGGRKPVQDGVRVKLSPGVTWDSLGRMTPEEIKERRLLPEGFKPLPHVKQLTGGQVFPNRQIDEIASQEQRRRFDSRSGGAANAQQGRQGIHTALDERTLCAYVPAANRRSAAASAPFMARETLRGLRCPRADDHHGAWSRASTSSA
jgi:hypothetical protein